MSLEQDSKIERQRQQDNSKINHLLHNLRIASSLERKGKKKADTTHKPRTQKNAPAIDPAKPAVSNPFVKNLEINPPLPPTPRIHRIRRLPIIHPPTPIRRPFPVPRYKKSPTCRPPPRYLPPPRKPPLLPPLPL